MPRRAAQRISGAVDEPNMVIPLASSYNERGVAGFTHTVTNSEDQRKINCHYEIARNAATGKGTLTLSKRPGARNSTLTCGSSTQTVYLVANAPGSSGLISGVPIPWVFNISATDIRVSSNSTSTVILAGGGTTRIPAFVDKTSISLAETVVLQLTGILTYGTVQKVYFSSAIATWTEIVDADFTALVHIGKMEHMDGFAFILTSTNQIFNSDSNSLANWTNTSFITKQIVQDYPVGLARLNNQILAFGDNTVEVFYNAGNTVGSPLGRIQQLHQRIGLVAPKFPSAGHYYAIQGNLLFFVGRQAGGMNSCGFFAYNGQSFEKVSTPYIDKILNETISDSTKFNSVNSVSVNGQKAIAILLNAVNSTSQRWLMFFPELKEWFEWTSTVFCPVNSGSYFLSSGTSLKDKLYYYMGGDAVSVTFSDNWQDDGTSYPWSTQFKLPTNGSSTKFMPMYGVDADTDTAGLGNTLTVEISTDDCVTFSTLGTIDLTADRKVLFEGGSFTKAWIRLGNTNSRPTRIHNWLSRLE